MLVSLRRRASSNVISSASPSSRCASRTIVASTPVTASPRCQRIIKGARSSTRRAHIATSAARGLAGRGTTISGVRARTPSQAVPPTGRSACGSGPRTGPNKCGAETLLIRTSDRRQPVRVGQLSCNDAGPLQQRAELPSRSRRDLPPTIRRSRRIARRFQLVQTPRSAALLVQWHGLPGALAGPKSRTPDDQGGLEEVPGEGLEPSHPVVGSAGLSRLRLPFRHPGEAAVLRADATPRLRRPRGARRRARWRGCGVPPRR